MSTTIKMRARIHQGGGVYYEDDTQYTVDDVVAQKLISQNAAIYVSGGPSSDVPVTATRDASNNVIELSAGGQVIVPMRKLLSYTNGATGLVVAAGAAESLFGPVAAIPANLLVAGSNLMMVATIQQAAASSAGARFIRVRSAATEAGLLAGSQAMAYQSTSVSNTQHIIDKYGTVLTTTEGRSGAIGLVGATATTGNPLTLAFAPLDADSFMQFSIANASDQALTVWAAALYLIP